MSEKVRIKARVLMIGEMKFLFITMLIGILMIESLNLLPLIFKSTIFISLQSYTDVVINATNVGFASVVLLLSLMSYCAFSLGTSRYFLRKSQGKNANIKDIFHYFGFRRIFPMFYFYSKFFVVKLCLFLICQAPTILVGCVLFFLLDNTVSTKVAFSLLICASLIFVSGLYFYRSILNSLYLVKYYYINGDYINFSHAISSSQEVMSRSKNSASKLKFGFYGWFLSCIFVIPIFYVWTYHNQAKAVLANILMEN